MRNTTRCSHLFTWPRAQWPPVWAGSVKQSLQANAQHALDLGQHELEDRRRDMLARERDSIGPDGLDRAGQVGNEP